AFEFVGYDELASEAHIKMMRQQDEQNEIILDRTPFYAESGGQVADTGMMSNGEEYLRVLDVQKSPDGYIHFTDKFPEHPEGEWQAMVDKERRREVRKHHSATHLVHAALKEVLGDHIAQKGSLVDETHLRFDFSHFEQITPDQLNRIEELVNEKIQQNIPLQEDRRVPIEAARERGATMLFGEKYGDRVRVISFDADFSMELCGGTHVNATGEIGYLRLVSEGSAAAGVRRVEARAGQSAERSPWSERDLLNNIRALVGQSDDLVHDIGSLINDRKSLEKEVEKLKHQQSLDKLNELFDRSAQLEGNILLVSGEIGQADMDLLKQLGYESLEKSKKRTV